MNFGGENQGPRRSNVGTTAVDRYVVYPIERTPSRGMLRGRLLKRRPGNDDPAENISEDHRKKSGGDAENDRHKPDDHGIDAKIFSKAAAETGDFLFSIRQVEAFHRNSVGLSFLCTARSGKRFSRCRGKTDD